MVVELSCEEVRREISNYLEEDVTPQLRAALETHLKRCKPCTAVLDGVRNTISLVGDERSFAVPAGLSRRLYQKLSDHLHNVEHDAEGSELLRDIPLGITEDYVPLGSHLIYFWESDADFERGVRFLYPGIGAGEHGIVFGHDEAIEKVLHFLRARGFDPDRLVENKELSVLRRHASAEATLSDISAILQAAKRAGATAVRFLGNLGIGRDPLPAGEEDVLHLENRATALITRFPCVIVCMYDVRTLPGRLIMKGGLESHRLAVCAEGVRENPYYKPEWPFPGLRHIH